MKSYLNCLEILEREAKKTNILKKIECDVEFAVGETLSQDLFAREDYPSFDNSAMDGFAIKFNLLTAQQLKGEEPIRVVSLLKAGEVSDPISNQALCVEIMTGAKIPDEYFTTVVKIEDTHVFNEGEHKYITLKIEIFDGQNIRKQGEDVRRGDLLLKKGARLRNSHLLTLYSQGITKVMIYQRVKFFLISTGEELVSPQTNVLDEGKIRNSTGGYLHKTLSSRGDVEYGGIVKDNINIFKGLILKNLKETDIFVSTGAVSKGVCDFIKDGLVELGFDIKFHKAKVRPGKPILFATFKYDGKDKFFFGLPGNPAASSSSEFFFIRPFLSYLYKHPTKHGFFLEVIDDIKKPEGFTCFYKAKTILEKSSVNVLHGQMSFMVAPFLEADSWAILKGEKSIIKKGEKVEVFFYEDY